MIVKGKSHLKTELYQIKYHSRGGNPNIIFRVNSLVCSTPLSDEFPHNMASFRVVRANRDNLEIIIILFFLTQKYVVIPHS